MGNQYTKASTTDAIPITARCPQRNRNIISVKNEQHRLLKDHTKNNTNQEKSTKNVTAIKGKLVEGSNCDSELKKKLPTQVYNSNTKNPETSLETNTKLRRKKRVKTNTNGDLPKEIETRRTSEEPNEIKKRQPFKQEKRLSSKAPSQIEVKLISDIFNTVAELESTFMDEKKFERRLRTAFSNQIENMQHLELSLHVEKERNKRLMELMNRYDTAEACTIKDSSIDSNNCLSPVSTQRSLKLKAIEPNGSTNHSERSKWSYQRAFSNATDTPISPLLMQQRYDEISKSYNTCQAELRRKDKLLTLAHCKQEALQAKCDRLTEQYLSSQRKIEALQHKISMLHKKTVQAKMSDSFDSDESSVEICKICQGTTRESLSNTRTVNVSEDEENVEELSLEKEDQRLNELEKYIIIESEKFLPKAKAE